MSSSPSISAASAFVQVLAAALLASATEVFVWAFRRVALGQFITSSWQIVWLTPLSYCAVLLPLALALALGARAWPRLVTSSVVVFASAFAAIFSVLFLFHPRLHVAADALLSLGAAAQVTRVSRRDAQRFLARTRRLAATVAGAALVLAAGMNGVRLLTEQRALGSTVTSTSGRPNVLLLVLDTVRASSLSVYGYERDTSPAIARFAARGVAFTNAFATAPWTLPSHATLFTGRYAHELSAGWETPLDRRQRTLAQVFAEQGYATAGFVANVGYASNETGLGLGFHHYEDYVVRPTDLIISSSPGRFVSNNPRFRAVLGYHDILGRRTAPDIRAALTAWLDRIGNRPFFAFLNFYDAHEPYLPQPPFNVAFGPVGYRDLGEIRHINAHMAERHDKWRMPRAEWGEEQRAYDQSIAYLDDHVGRLLDDLLTQRLENTIVVITSDHGELFGEHGLFSHGNSLYLPALHVPLIVVYPPRVERGREDAAVSLRDVAATILDLAGIDATSLPGRSLLASAGERGRSEVISAIEPAPNQHAEYPSARGPMRSLITDDLHYIRNGDGREELYRWRTDPAETQDLAGDESSRPHLEALRKTIDAAGATSRPHAEK